MAMMFFEWFTYHLTLYCWVRFQASPHEISGEKLTLGWASFYPYGFISVSNLSSDLYIATPAVCPTWRSLHYWTQNGNDFFI